MARGVLITPAQRKACIAALRRGLSAEAAAQEAGVSKSAARDLRRLNHIPTKGREAPKPRSATHMGRQPSRIDPQRRAEIEALIRKGLSRDTIHRQTGSALESIRKVQVDLGVVTDFEANAEADAMFAEAAVASDSLLDALRREHAAPPPDAPAKREAMFRGRPEPRGSGCGSPAADCAIGGGGNA